MAEVALPFVAESEGGDDSVVDVVSKGEDKLWKIDEQNVGYCSNLTFGGQFADQPSSRVHGANADAKALRRGLVLEFVGETAMEKKIAADQETVVSAVSQ